MIQVCVNVDDIGVYKMNRIAPWLGVDSKTINNLLKIPFLKHFLKKALYVREYFQMRKIKNITRSFDCPVTWAVVPYRCGFHASEERLDKASPLIYRLLKKYVKDGDEIIQHGTYHTSDEFSNKLSKEEQQERIKYGWVALKEMFPDCKKVMQAPKWKANKDTLAALTSLGFEGLLGGNVVGLKTSPLKTTHHLILTKLVIDRNFFTEQRPTNLILHPNHDEAIIELKKWLEFANIINGVEFVTCSKAMK